MIPPFTELDDPSGIEDTALRYTVRTLQAEVEKTVGEGRDASAVATRLSHLVATIGNAIAKTHQYRSAAELLVSARAVHAAFEKVRASGVNGECLDGLQRHRQALMDITVTRIGG
ncbi:MAG: hypothetical protein WCS85_03915 [Candidatus Peribacteraceae bacterium]